MLPPANRKVASIDTDGQLTARQKGKGREISPNGIQSVPASPVGVDVNGLDGRGKYGLESRPELDTARAEELCGIEEGERDCAERVEMVLTL